MVYSFDQALNTVKEKLAGAPRPASELVPLVEAQGRVLAEDVAADRDYPPFHRSIRDGFAVRAADVATVPAELRIIGEVRAGRHFSGAVGPDEAVSIMTGAPLPEGADAVVMVEFTETTSASVGIQRTVKAGENVVPQGSEARQGSCVLRSGRRLGPAEMGLLATVGKTPVPVFARPVVAIVSTGDEVVPVEQQPEWFQIRNSNAMSLSGQIVAAGGTPRRMAIAADHPDTLRTIIQQALGADLVLLTGGVSVGKYDFVEQVLAELGAEFYFTSVALRPGKPLVFGRVAGKFFFGLPGNPVSAMVTFAAFVRPALGMLSGAGFEAPSLVRARLHEPFEQRTGLTVFVPGRVAMAAGGPTVRRVNWQGSGDLVAVAASNCFIVVHPQQNSVAAGEWVDIMLM